MKYFTLEWWAEPGDNHLAVFRAYEAYISSVKNDVLVDLLRVQEEISLHDSRLRRMEFSSESKSLLIDLDGCHSDDGGLSYSQLKIRLLYDTVLLIESSADPEKGLAGPHGYGDLGYDEIEVVRVGVFQHRMLFSTGIELSVTFSGFSLEYQKVKPT
jgi:hypothetical protein